MNAKKRGGDIDLLVRTASKKKGVLARIRMISRLKQYLGDQKIDVIGGTQSAEKGNTTDMTERKQEITERLGREFGVCDKHILRINEALEGLCIDLPISADCYANLNTDKYAV